MSEQGSKDELIAAIREFKDSVRGLSMEIEGWRQHTSSSGEFALGVLRDILGKLNTVLDKVNNELR